MMSSKCLLEDERMQYDKEFSEFLIQRIEQAGGSLQFHHLTGLLQQARFEIRDAFGATKSELMKFLKAHPNIFQIDPMGIVTITTSSVSYESSYDIDTNRTAENKEPLPTKIENGTGLIIKLHSEFGIIKASSPIKTEIHFKSDAFSNNKHSLLSDFGLEIGHKVSFNAVYGHDDYDIKFRASKVWQKSDGNVNIHESHLEGEGVIQKLSSDVGYISVVGKENEIVYFDKRSVKDCTNIELTKFLKVGDPVEFSASKQKDCKTQWKAIVVSKKLKKDNAQSSHTKTKIIDDTFKKRIENESGKIFPHSHGAIIKFGKDFSERADGDSSTYFLYGAEVSDIAFEFSEGDDVWFNAIRTKSAPGWKAILVWVGEKPTCVNTKRILDEEINEFSNDKSCVSSSNISSVSDNSSLRSKTLKYKSHVSTTEQVTIKTNNKSQSFDHPGNRKDQSGRGYIKQKSKLSKSLQSSSAMKSKKGKGRTELEKTNKNEGNQYRTVAKSLLMYKPEWKTSSINKHIDAKYRSDRELCEISDFCDEDCENYLSCKDDMSDTSQDSIQDDIQTALHNERYDKSFVSASKYNFSGSEEDDIDSTCNEICKSTDKKEPSIKNFEDVDGEIINLYCKAAIIKSPHLQKNVDFVLNAFYLNGKSVEEQQVIDLKEIIKVGDKVKFNCFEIIDDSGEIHQKVTMAWTGRKPKVYEMTPEEFINEHDLSVTVSEELVSELVPEHRTVLQNFLTVVPNLEETFKTTLQNSSDDMSDNEMFRQSRTSETQIRENLDEKELLLDTHELSKMIIQRLKSKGLISLDLQVDITSVLAEIISIVQKNCSDSECSSLTSNEAIMRNSKDISQAVCFTCGEKKSKTLSGKYKTDKNAAVQTIITGGIIAQNERFLGEI